MKILILQNKLQNFPIDWDIERTKQFYKERLPEVEFDFTVMETDILYDIQRTILKGQPADVLKDPFLNLTSYKGYDLIINCYNIKELVTIPYASRAFAINFASIYGYIYNEIPIYAYPGNENKHWVVIAHEIVHALWFKIENNGGVRNDDMDLYDGNNIPDTTGNNFDRNLGRIKNLINYITMNKWVYFKPDESTGGTHKVSELEPKLVDMLDKARSIAGTPFKLTSGYRTLTENTLAGGAKDSAHMYGLAVDIHCDNTSRTKILRGLLTCGTPCFIEVAGTHVHADLYSKNHPIGDTMWGNDAN